MTEHARIPMYVHLIGPSWEELSPQLQMFLMSQVLRNHTLTYTFWDDKSLENFLREVCSEKALTAYEHLNKEDYPQAKADFAKWFIMLLFGGIYVDLKSGIANMAKLFEYEPLPPFVVMSCNSTQQQCSVSRT